MGTKPTFTVFYAWQSDVPEKFNRKLIRNALEDAIERLNSDDGIPVSVELDHDTRGVPGLCDIPATILAKIEKADALVADLTYVAKSASAVPRHCSNPNVLFELGFAFHAVGWERLILVMNEAYGPRTEQIFDLDHRRHPITFRATENSTNLSHTTSKLAEEIYGAIRAVIDHGVREAIPKSEDAFAKRYAQVDAFFAQQATQNGLLKNGHWSFSFHPQRFDRTRWDDNEGLEEAIRRNAIVYGFSGSYPSHLNGSTDMSWGIYNQYRGELWCLTAEGLFLSQEPLNPDSRPFRANYQVIGEDNPPHEVPAGKWIGLEVSLESMFNFFRFFGKFIREFPAREPVLLHITTTGLSGKSLVHESGRALDDPTMAAVEDRFAFSDSVTAESFPKEWKDLCAVAMKRFVELFPNRYGRVKTATMRKWVDRFNGDNV
jgi:hypothetical protein